MEALVKELVEANIGKVRENEPLAKHTTMKIGGPADVLVEPDSVDHLKVTMDIIKKHGVKWRAIGRGSNLLVSDKGIEGVVIKLGAGLDDLTVDGETVTVGGDTLASSLQQLLQNKVCLDWSFQVEFLDLWEALFI